MEEGFVLGLPGRAALAVSTWIEGPPKRETFFGLNIRGRKRIRIRTFRCSGCGYLESYANNDSD
jgi:hypothetical protein